MTLTMNYCSNCGARVAQGTPAGDDRQRFICRGCGTVHYQNPKVVVGCVPEHRGRILLCKRDIEPRSGKWTLPAGYLENHETLEQGALRETIEETSAMVEIIAPYRLFNLAFINQLYLMFRARLLTADFRPTPESSEIRLFAEDQIPWEDMAFQVITKTLRHYFKDRATGTYTFEQHEILDPHIS